MSTRAILQSIIDSNVYDNSNKEILASMMRTVLEALMNSDFNKDDDQLQNLKYNASKTLAQQFALLPIIKKAKVGPFNVGYNGIESIDVEGDDIVSCVNNQTGPHAFLDITFSVDITNTNFIFNLEIDNPTGGRLIDNGNLLYPVYGILNPTTIRIQFREIDARAQYAYLKIIMI